MVVISESLFRVSFQCTWISDGPSPWPSWLAEPWGRQDGELRGHASLQVLPPQNLPTSHLFLSAADKTCHVCRWLPSLQDDSPLPPPPSMSAFRISRRGSAAFLRLQACSARDARCFQRAPCGNSLPGFHMTASSAESHSREWKIAVRVGVRREQSGMGRWRGEEV